MMLVPLSPWTGWEKMGDSMMLFPHFGIYEKEPLIRYQIRHSFDCSALIHIIGPLNRYGTNKYPL